MEGISYRGHYQYISLNNADLFTAVLLPGEGIYPTVVQRSPYVDHFENVDEATVVTRYLAEQQRFLAAGYAVVYQHCRGRGKSSGDCIPYIHEREDGLALLDWIRQQPFYNGELYLVGGSYNASVHFVTAPYPEDIKGAVLHIQDTERYNICYRNGHLKIGLHGDWYVGMYKAKTMKKKPYTAESFNTLPLSAFTETVFGEPAADFDEMLRHPHPTDAFWNTRYGGNDARGALDHVAFPVMMRTGMFDIYTGGIFDMWRAMTPATRSRCALVVSAYGHGDGDNGTLVFPKGSMGEQFGDDLDVKWLESIRHGSQPPFEQGKITYYRLFENTWATDTFSTQKTATLPIGEGTVTYTYNPYDAPGFRGGLSCNFGGSAYQDSPGRRRDIVTTYTPLFAQDTFIKGKMHMDLQVSSDCEDTAFYVRLSLPRDKGDFGLRDDITSLCFQLGDYTPGDRVTLCFDFDDIACLVHRGERLRIDIASANKSHYVRHTNQKGLFSEQTTAKIAHNTVYLDGSSLTVPVE